MKRAVVVLAVASLGVAEVGCVADPCAGKTNGKLGVLEFAGPSAGAAQGLQTQVTLLRRRPGWFEGPFILTRDPATCFAFDDADIQVTLPEAFGGETATVERPPGKDLFIRFKCSVPNEQLQEVTVKVVAPGGEVRYQDAFDITCHQLVDAMAGQVQDLNGRALTFNGYAVGGLVHVNLSLTGPSFTPLSGFGATSVDGLLEDTGVRDFDTLVEAFRAVAPGQSPVLDIAGRQSPLTTTLVDSAAWELKLEPQQTGNTSLLGFSAWPELSDGTKLDGLDTCQWVATTATESQVLTDTTCDLSTLSSLPGTNNFITQLCVTGLGRTACTSISR